MLVKSPSFCSAGEEEEEEVIEVEDLQKALPWLKCSSHVQLWHILVDVFLLD